MILVSRFPHNRDKKNQLNSFLIPVRLCSSMLLSTDYTALTMSQHSDSKFSVKSVFLVPNNASVVEELLNDFVR